MEKLKSGNAIARRYRNRRTGEFLKEIDLSEKIDRNYKNFAERF